MHTDSVCLLADQGQYVCVCVRFVEIFFRDEFQMLEATCFLFQSRIQKRENLKHITR